VNALVAHSMNVPLRSSVRDELFTLLEIRSIRSYFSGQLYDMFLLADRVEPIMREFHGDNLLGLALTLVTFIPVFSQRWRKRAL
jgi:hypothetical protein